MNRDARGVGWWCMSVGLVVGVLFVSMFIAKINILTRHSTAPHVPLLVCVSVCLSVCLSACMGRLVIAGRRLWKLNRHAKSNAKSHDSGIPLSRHASIKALLRRY